MDIGKSKMSADDIKKALPEEMAKLNGVYELVEFAVMN